MFIYRDFKSSRYAGTISELVKKYNTEDEYCWSRLSPDLQERLFDSFLVMNNFFVKFYLYNLIKSHFIMQDKYTFLPGSTKEDYRPAFVRVVKRRMNDIYYRARCKALAQVPDDCPDCFEEAKRFPPNWCLPDR